MPICLEEVVGGHSNQIKEGSKAHMQRVEDQTKVRLEVAVELNSNGERVKQKWWNGGDCEQICRGRWWREMVDKEARRKLGGEGGIGLNQVMTLIPLDIA